jgi:hypothetical protein
MESPFAVDQNGVHLRRRVHEVHATLQAKHEDAGRESVGGGGIGPYDRDTMQLACRVSRFRVYDMVIANPILVEVTFIVTGR